MYMGQKYVNLRPHRLGFTSSKIVVYPNLYACDKRWSSRVVIWRMQKQI